MFGAVDRHWWFVARRKIIQKILNSWPHDGTRSILEIGCGTGGNLKLLSTYGAVSGVEQDDKALSLANGRKICPVKKGALPDSIPFAQTFDLICLLDVLEHITDDLAALQAARNKLLPTGKVLITVPAYNFLWSSHDVELHHKRRYNRKDLSDLLLKAGFKVRYSTYFNTFLFPLIAVIRICNSLFKRQSGTDVSMPPGVINKSLMKIFSGERFFLPGFSLPFGVSILVLAEKTEKQRDSSCMEIAR
jgi:SAM-dependent methyltransferase